MINCQKAKVFDLLLPSGYWEVPPNVYKMDKIQLETPLSSSNIIFALVFFVKPKNKVPITGTLFINNKYILF